MDLFQLSATLTLDTSEYDAGVRSATQDMQSLSSQFDATTDSAKGLSDTFKSVLSANFIGDFLKSGADFAKQLATESISLASDLEEVQNVVDVTFGSDAQRIDRWAKKAKNAFGMGELSAKQFSGTIGSMLKSMGLTSDQVTSMSEQLVQLTGDMASFYNLDHDTAFEKIRAGISGETEPLKQLGINMSVANLEAFATSKGMQTAYEKMSQAEQATLRYEYLMEATASAQGDFARTSDGYANSARTLAENINSLKSNVGEMLLPLVTDVVGALNSLFDRAETTSLASLFGDIDQGVQEQTVEANDKYNQVSALIDFLDKLNEDGEIEASELNSWNAALKQITQTIPELSQYINLQTGEIEGGTAALRENAKAWRDNLVEQAKTSAIKEKLDAYFDAVERQANIEVQMTANTGSMTGAIENAFALAQPYAEAYAKDTHNALEPTIASLATFMEYANSRKNGIFGNAPGLTNEQVEQWHELGGSIESYLKISEEARLANGPLAEESAQLAEEIPWAYEELKLLGDAIGLDIDGLIGLTDATGEAGDASGEAAEMTEAEINAYKKLETALKEVQDYRQKTVDSARASLDSLAGGFDQIVDAFDGDKDAVKASLKDMFSGLEDQKDYFDNYAVALQTAAEKGVSEGLLAQLSDGSQQSAAYLKAINSATDEEIAAFNAKWQETEEAKDTLSQVMADAQLAVDTEYQAMIDAAQATSDAIVDAMDRGDDAKLSGLSTAQGVADGLAEGEAAISARVSEINALLANLAAGSYAYARANAAGIASRIAGPAAPSTSASNADGLSYVPYDDYLSYLHKGEAVLTAAQAEDWRAGRASSAQPASIDYAALGRAVAQAIAGLSVQMDGQTVGHIVAPTVSADIAEGSRTTRRYAVV